MSRWFRFYSGVVSDPKAQMLSPELFKHWVNLLCIASQNDGELPDIDVTAFMLGRITESKAAEILARLHKAGLLDKTDESFRPHNWDARQYKHDSNDPTNADRQKRFRNKKSNTGSNANSNGSNGESNGDKAVTAKRPDSTEYSDNSERSSEAIASGAEAPNDPSIAEREFFKRGRDVLGKGAGGQLAKLKASKGHNIALARAAIETAATKNAPAEYIAAIIRGPPAKPLTAHQQERETGREILDDIGKFISSSGRETDTRVLRHDPGNEPESLRGGARRSLVNLSADGVGKGS